MPNQSAEPRPRDSERASLIGLFILLCAVALLFGGVNTVVWAGFSFGVSLILLYMATRGDLPGRLLQDRRFLVVAILYGSVCIWAAIQALPVVPDWLAHPIWAETRHVEPISDRNSISINPEDTLDGLIRLLAYGGTFLIAYVYANRQPKANRIIRFSVLLTTVMAAYGLLQHLADVQYVLWIPKARYLDSATGPFINRNSFATFLGLGIIASLHQLLRSVLQPGTSMKTPPHSGLRFAWPVMIFSGAILIQLSALLATHSRAGIIASFLGAIAFVAARFLAGAPGTRKIAARLSALTIVAMLMLAAFFGSETLERLSDAERAFDSRSRIYILTIEAVADQPLTGSGLGTFEEALRFYRPASIKHSYRNAHNDYLETMLELGLPAFLALMTLFLILVRHSVASVVHRNAGSAEASLSIACIVTVGSHAFLDFSLQIPAVAALFALLLAVGLSRAVRPSEDAADLHRQMQTQQPIKSAEIARAVSKRLFNKAQKPSRCRGGNQPFRLVAMQAPGESKLVKEDVSATLFRVPRH